MRSLSGKIILLSLLICSITGLTFSTIMFYQNWDHLAKAKISENENNVRLFSERVSSGIDDLVNDVDFLSSIEAVQRIVQSNGKDKTAKAQLQKLFVEVLHAKSHYLQLRLILFNKEGREFIRVERSRSKVVVVKESSFQNKADESYFKSTMETPAEKVYLSNFSLNREYGKIAYPLKMTLRASRPLHKSKTKGLFGFIIINADYTDLFRGIDRISNNGVEYSILDNQNKVIFNTENTSDALSNYIVTTDNAKNMEKKISLVNSFNKNNHMNSQLADDRNIHIINKIHYNTLDPSRYIIVYLTIPKSLISAQISREVIKNAFFIFILILISYLTSIYFGRKVTAPIKSLLRIAKELSDGKSVDLSKIEYDTKGEIGSLTKTILDMNEDILRKNVQLESQKQALDSSAIVAETDLRGKITYVNDKFVEISKYSQKELMGKDHRILNSGYHPKDFFARLWKTISNGEIWKGEVKNRAKDGTFYWVATTIYPVKDENGEIKKYVAIRFDVTDRKEIEEKLILASEKAKKSTQQKSEFLANISHEIRTPLNSVIGLSDVLSETVLTEEQGGYVVSLRESSNSLMHIVNDVLDLSKMDAGQLRLESREFDLNDLIHQVFDVVSLRAHEKNLNLAINIDENVPIQIIGDSMRLKQILLNLLGNAIKFTEKGHVSLEVSCVREVNKDTSLVEFTVVDSGIGIDKENLNKIFQSFTQANNSITRKYGGTGLGLNIVKQLVEIFGGEVTVESKVNEGSKFKVRLQLQFNPTCLIKKVHLNHLLGKKKILVADEFQMSRLVLKRTLESWGAHVIEAITGTQALSEILDAKEKGENFDILFIDADLSGVSGKDVIIQLSEINTSTENIIYMMNQNYSQSSCAEIQSYNVKVCLRKPILSANLQSAIRTVYSQQVEGKVLLVDDDPTILEELQFLLNKNNFEIELAKSKEEAAMILEQKSFDTIVCDLNLPGDSGISLVSGLRREGNQTPFVILSGFISDEVSDLLNSYNVCEVFEKPHDVNSLLNTVKKMVLNYKAQQAHSSVLLASPVLDKSILPLKILVAEDSEKNRKLLSIYFKDLNYQIDYAHDGQEAIKMFKEKSYDVIFMDMQMPIMDGYDATRSIRILEKSLNRPKVAIIALTANALDNQKTLAFDAGCDDYLTKPIKKNILLNSLNFSLQKTA